MKNAHGVEITPVETRLAEVTAEIAEKLQLIQRMNSENADIDHTCVELAALHSLFGRKHALMRRLRGNRVDLDRYANREAGACTG